MIEKLKAFFEANPEANECHVALGYFHTTHEEAKQTLAGVSGEVIKTYTKEQFEAMLETKKASEAEVIVIEMRERTVEEIKALIAEHEQFMASEQEKIDKARSKALKVGGAVIMKKHQEKLDAMKYALELKLKEEVKQPESKTAEETKELESKEAEGTKEPEGKEAQAAPEQGATQPEGQTAPEGQV